MLEAAVVVTFSVVVELSSIGSTTCDAVVLVEHIFQGLIF